MLPDPDGGNPKQGATFVRADRATSEMLALFLRNPTPMLLVDAETLRIAVTNEAATRRLGLSRAALDNLRFTELVPGADDGTGEDLARRRLVSEDFLLARGRWPVMKRTGGIETFHVAREPLTVQGRRAYLLYAAPEASHARPGEGTIPFAESELERFTFHAFHDLKEPIHLLRGYLKLLEERIGPSLDAEAREFLVYATTGADRMQGLVASMLEYFRVGAVPPSTEPVDLQLLVREALGTVHWAIRESGARVDVGPLPCVLGDKTQLRQVMENLVSNAVKFHGAKAPHVQVGANQTPDGWVVTVSDDGIGIDARDHEKIFEPFHRVYSQDQFPGTGLGLAYGRRVMDGLGGRVWVESSLGHGATFHLLFPKED